MEAGFSIPKDFFSNQHMCFCYLNLAKVFADLQCLHQHLQPFGCGWGWGQRKETYKSSLTQYEFDCSLKLPP